MDGESDPGWIAFLTNNTYSFYESFIEGTILDSTSPSVSREVTSDE